MHKNAVPDVDPRTSNSMVKLLYTNSDSTVWSVGDLLYGRRSITLSTVASTGSSYG
jgi:hypothetical protein